MKIDLHVHSTYSDGAFTPQKVVDTAIEQGIEALAITDHDNVLAFEHAQAYAAQKAEEAGKNVIEILPGVEINTLWEGHEIHILGYFMDFQNQPFQDMLKYQQHARAEQTIKILDELRKQEHIDISFEQIKSLVAEGGSIGRPHIAKSIVTAGGVGNIIEAYNKFINDRSPVYVRRKTVSPHEAVETIYDAGGIPVIAHPCDLEKVEDLIKDLMNYGLRGIEAYHRKHSPAMVEYYSSMAEELGLIVTGGSDFHGPSMSGQIFLGKNFIPDWVLTELKKEKNRIQIAKI